jgi:hypothetical protein
MIYLQPATSVSLWFPYNASESEVGSGNSTATLGGMKRFGFLLDVLLLLLFVVIGRSNHHDGLRVAGVANTFWPFATGLLVGWVWVRRGNKDPLSRVGGTLIVLATVAIGMLLRALSGQGIALSFVIVATLFLSLFLVGWRLALIAATRPGKKA